MLRDPFYRDIIRNLNERLDDQIFERCAVSLLRKYFPTLVLIPGGSDGGKDGAVADSDGEPFPLITTVRSDVIGNFTKNLNTYISNWGERRKVLLATSQVLSDKRRENLHSRARELGFTLIQIYDQEAFAELLYESPRWCVELLNLTGTPSALSIFPKSNRPFYDTGLIGRDKDYDWISLSYEGIQDRLLVGQPGSGKTFLLQKLAKEDGGLFAVSSVRKELADAIREQQPNIIIVDDAHIKLDLLSNLKQIRDELGATFSILASSWLGEKDTVTDVLGIPNHDIYALTLLPRNDILEIINNIGIYGPDWLLGELVDQAEGRPGLAVTLTHLCILGGGHEVITGEALRRSLTANSNLGDLATEILATLAVGGDVGLKMSEVAGFLGLGEAVVRSIMTKLEASGVILETYPHHLSIRPPQFRFALIPEVFFNGGVSLSIERLLNEVDVPVDEAAFTLILSKGRGANVPDELLIALLQQCSSHKAWRAYTSLGKREAEWVLGNYPDIIGIVAYQALEYAPRIALPLLMARGIDDDRPLNSSPDHSLRIIEDWIKEPSSGTNDVLARREILIDVSIKWLDQGQDTEIGIKTLVLAFEPQTENRSTDPGLGNTVTVHFGYLNFEELQYLQNLWPRVLKTLQKMLIANWNTLFELIDKWVFKRQSNVEMSKEAYDLKNSIGRQIFEDLLPLAGDNLGIIRRFKQLAFYLNWDIDIKLDPIFEMVYPIENIRDAERSEKEQLAKVDVLATEWSKLDAHDVVEKIQHLEEMAIQADHRYPRLMPYLCRKISQSVKTSKAWADLMIEAGLDGDVVYPFLQRATETQEDGWIELLLTCMEVQHLKAWAICLILAQTNPPEILLVRMLDEVANFTQTVEVQCLRNQVSENNLKLLLNHEDPATASAAALGDYHADPKGTVRENILQAWEYVITEHGCKDYWMEEIFKKMPHLALQWLQRRIEKRELDYNKFQKAIPAAISALSMDNKRLLLSSITDDYRMYELIDYLIGSDLQFYKELLSNDRLDKYHLAPLYGLPDNQWIEKALLALDRGYTPTEIYGASYGINGRVFTWSGEESNMWARRLEEYEKLLSHHNKGIQEIGQIGVDATRQSMDRALQREANEAIYGIR